jgi:hypothetical protein
MSAPLKVSERPRSADLTRFRPSLLLLCGLALLLFWYFTGGQEFIDWLIAAREAEASGWDISGLYRDLSPHPMGAALLIAGAVLFLYGAVAFVMDGIRGTRKAMHGRTN